jgi:hypothetical protein
MRDSDDVLVLLFLVAFIALTVLWAFYEGNPLYGTH